MKVFSIKWKLLIIVSIINIVVVSYFISFSKNKSSELGRDVLMKDAQFITSLLSDNLALSVESMILDNGDSLVKTLQVLNSNQDKDMKSILQVWVYDKDMTLLRAMDESNKNRKITKVEKISFIERDRTVEAVAPLKNASKTTVGYVAIDFSKKFLLTRADSTAKSAFVVGLFVVIAVIIINLIFAISIVRPLSRTVSLIKSIAEGEGDLTRRLPKAGRDEVGQLVFYFNIFLDKMQDLVYDIRGTANTTIDGIVDINDGFQKLSDESQDQAKSLDSVVTTINHITSSIRKSADQADNSAKIANELVSLSQAGKEILSMAIAKIKEVKTSSKRIEEIITLVNDIATQTNLLALNAAIEAARAGEFGEGFAVVASEVRKLAFKSSDAANEIGQLIKSSNEKVDKGNEESMKSGEMFETISKKIDDLQKLVQEISHALQDQASGADQISASVGELDRITHSNLKLVDNLAENSMIINDEANDLSDLVAKFKV